ncbi:MAG: Glutamyl-tRNA(Gln) amidotransferase subunit A [Candidatus Jorgensenbacteria bacterium GW2011_GWA2_45_9]|uniref:Glutamyl-tRNA(Gln) amidotransferase subunit A n=1 Tax=Candidatus Jorgensenbacteria bacterium GW2011_GWA2_45_9 TaxID=1618663 RepID=A0A0G1R0E3_9BACT|nr:MAG: Glutamyl-tRNA(Gln) amidotransferase subunit A [Candidatus Jorgensenbacteria bacterium GW2011_GWA2_45_9]
MDISGLTIKSFHNALQRKEFSAREATDFYFKRISEDDSVRPFISTLEIQARERADAVDKMLADGDETGPLAGVPMAIKDNILIENTPVTAGSQILKNYFAGYNATVIEKLKKENCVFLGKTNLDEFAMGSSTENSSFHITKNPHDLKRVPGGSSSPHVLDSLRSLQAWTR